MMSFKINFKKKKKQIINRKCKIRNKKRKNMKKIKIKQYNNIINYYKVMNNQLSQKMKSLK